MARTVKNKSKAGVEKDAGFCVYLGPTIAGVIQRGAMFKGSKEQAFEAAAMAIQKYPLVKSLIVSSQTLVEDRIKVANPGTLLYRQCQQLLSGKSK
jgi:hypothetical protein